MNVKLYPVVGLNEKGQYVVFALKRSEAEARTFAGDCSGPALRLWADKPVEVPASDLLQIAGTQLEEVQGNQCFPAFDYQGVPGGDTHERYRAIQSAAWAVMNPADEAAFVPLRQVGCLVRYLGELMEA